MTGDELDGVDFDLLADYVGGALTGTPDEDRVAALVAGDQAWRSAYEQIAPAMASVGTALGDLPPEPMPDDLAARLDSLFRTAPVPSPVSGSPAAGTAGAAVDDAAPAVPVKVLDLEDARRARAARPGARRWRRWAAPISVAAAAVAFGGLGLSQLSNSASEDTAASSEAPASAEVNTAMKAGVPAAERILRSGIDYSAETLAQAPAAAVQTRVSEDDSTAPEVEGSDDSPLARLFAPDALLACIEAIARENGGELISVRLVDYAGFEGRPAMIVQFTATNGGWAWAVGPECGASGTGAAALQKVPVR